MNRTLKTRLCEWTDFDFACHELACVLEVYSSEVDETLTWGGKKWVYWSDNHLGNTLYKILLSLVDCGVLEKNDEDQFRYSRCFDWSELEPPYYELI